MAPRKDCRGEFASERTVSGTCHMARRGRGRATEHTKERKQMSESVDIQVTVSEIEPDWCRWCPQKKGIGMQTVAALFVQKNGAYYNLPGVDPWPEERDARKYAGPH